VPCLVRGPVVQLVHAGRGHRQLPARGHPVNDFFESGEQSPVKSSGPVLGDGFVIVHYQPDLPPDQLG
jgi:hypothetical protein